MSEFPVTDYSPSDVAKASIWIRRRHRGKWESMMRETEVNGADGEPDLQELDEATFIALWRDRLGQPPALMLGRAEMVAILRAAEKREDTRAAA